MKLVTPISHLFENDSDAQQIIDVSDSLEARERTCNYNFKDTTHYHIDFDLNLGLTDKQEKFLFDHVRPREYIKTLTFQAAKDCLKASLMNGMYVPISPIIPLRDQVNNTKKSLLRIRDIVGSERNIGIENNNYYPTGAYEICTSIEFLHEILEFKNLHLLLDIAHALVTSGNKFISFSSYVDNLFETGKCKQIHLCQPTYNFDSGAISVKDSHEIPSLELTELTLHSALKWGVDYLTVEYYKDSKKLVSYLAFLRKLMLKI